MTMDEFKIYVKEKMSEFPDQHRHILDQYEIACEEIDDEGSEHGEIESAVEAIEQLIEGVNG